MNLNFDATWPRHYPGIEGESRFSSSQGSAKGFCEAVTWNGQQREADRGEWVAFANQDARITTSPLGTYTEDEHRCKSCAAEVPDLRIIQGDR